LVAFLDAAAELLPLGGQYESPVLLINQKLLVVQALEHAGDGGRLHVQG